MNGISGEDLVLERYIEKAINRIKNGVVVDEEEEDEESEDLDEDIDDLDKRKRAVSIVRKQNNRLQKEVVDDPAIYTVKGMIALMRHPEKGLKLKTRHHFFKSYKKCFVGK